ncbi:MAG: NUDIX domain-containing protein [Verrucomicrobia bacterium]|nr:NUDIX domain-containing protein [Verrucomicrobiota bacterium]MCF7707573.1 NUDIX domain-containing protein [Verrucomicrobiota bacterium]
MTEEVYDVVDEQNEVIGAASRSEIHRRGLNHRSAHVLVFNNAGHVYLQKRSMKKDTFPGAWDSSAAGHIDRGESYEHGAVRELKEELGISRPPALEYLFSLSASPATGNEFVRIYKCTANGPFTHPPDEIDYGKWFTYEEVDREIKRNPSGFADAFLLIWPIYRESFTPKDDK